MPDVELNCLLDPPLENWTSHITCRTMPMLVSGVEALAEAICDLPEGVASFLELSDTPDSYAGSAGMSVVVNGAEDALEFATITTTDELVKVSANDTTANYLLAKLAAGTGISLAETNDGGDEDVTITASITLEQARTNGSAMLGAFTDAVATATTTALTLKTTDDSSVNRLFKTTSSGDVEEFAISGKGSVFVSPLATTGTPSPSITVTAPAHTALTASTEYTDLQFNLSRTIQFATGALTTQRTSRFRAPTLSAVAASTITNAINVEIDTPIAGTNATLTNSIGLRVSANAVTHVPAVFNGFTSHTGHLVNFQVNATTLSSITAQGQFHFGSNAENSMFAGTKSVASTDLLSVAYQGLSSVVTQSYTTASSSLKGVSSIVNTGSSGSSGFVYGGTFETNHRGSGTGISFFTCRALGGVDTSGSSNLTLVDLFRAQVYSPNATFHMTTFKGFNLAVQTVTTKCTTAYGLFMDSIKLIAATAANSYAINLTDGLVVFNESGDADADVRFEGDTDSNLFTTDASTESASFGVAVGSHVGKLHVQQISTTGAKPVITLQQKDLSEEFMRIIGESAADNSQSLVDAVNLPIPGAIAGWYKLYVQDDAGAGAIADGVYYVPFYTTPL